MGALFCFIIRGTVVSKREEIKFNLIVYYHWLIPSKMNTLHYEHGVFYQHFYIDYISCLFDRDLHFRCYNLILIINNIC